MKIDHIAIWCRDLEKLREFYMKYFEATSNEKYTNISKGFSSYFLSFESGARLELMKMDSVPETKDDPIVQFTGLIHFAMSLGSESQVDALTERLKDDGHQVIDDPRRTGDGYYESVVFDPEGNRIEITV
ncbi:MAG: VOC family protein [Opitutales bacterium]|nr:VOC family protein [Opitutales bacterium]